MSTSTRPPARSLRHKFVVSVIVTALLIPAPAAAVFLRTTDEIVRAGGNQIRDWLLAVFRTTTDPGNRERKGVRPSPPPSKAEREAKVAKLELNVASEIELKSRQR